MQVYSGLSYLTPLHLIQTVTGEFKPFQMECPFSKHAYLASALLLAHCYNCYRWSYKCSSQSCVLFGLQQHSAMSLNNRLSLCAQACNIDILLIEHVAMISQCLTLLLWG